MKSELTYKTSFEMTKRELTELHAEKDMLIAAWNKDEEFFEDGTTTIEMIMKAPVGNIFKLILDVLGEFPNIE